MSTALLSLALASQAVAQEATPDDAKSPAVVRRAIEAVVWGMPAVNYDLMLQEMLTETEGEVNHVLYWSQPPGAMNQTLTPNPDTIYSMVFFDLTAGPMVLEVPPAEGGALNGTIMNVWQMPLADVGLHGADQGAGGRYVLLPPGYAEAVPEGFTALPSDTFGAYALLRSNLEGRTEEEIARGRDYGMRVQVYPLAQADAPPPTVFTDAQEVRFDATIRYDASFFENLDRIVQSEPWLERDRLMIDYLRTIGIEKGQPFALDAGTTALLDTAAEEARAFLEARYDAGLEGFFTPEGQWFFPISPDFIEAQQTGYADLDAYPNTMRGVLYSFAFAGLKSLGAGQYYLVAIRDGEGEAFDGGQTYRLTVPPDVPVEQYWSVTVYDRETHTLLPGMPYGSRSSQLPELQANADGSVDLFIGPEAPQRMESNWLPTDPTRPFELMLRVYGPTPAFFEKAWFLPDVEKVE